MQQLPCADGQAGAVVGRLAVLQRLAWPAVGVPCIYCKGFTPRCLHPTATFLQGLERGECEAAGSVGVNLTLVHSWTRACLRAGMLSEDGRCKTLDASAGGWCVPRCRVMSCAGTAEQLLKCITPCRN